MNPEIVHSNAQIPAQDAPRRARTSREVRDQIVGKCVAGVIARAGREGEPPVVLVMQFDDGSTVEFVSPRGDRLLRSALRETHRRADAVAVAGAAAPAQLALAVA